MTPHLTTSGFDYGSTCPLRPRALVMDDDPLFRTLLVAMLKRDYTVVVAADGSEGFYKALEVPPQIAIVDVQMPVWDGLRTLKAFRDHASLREIPLLVLSSDATQGTLLAAIAAGADDYLIKSSFSREELLLKLHSLRDRLMSGRPAVSESRTDDGLLLVPSASYLPTIRQRESAAVTVAGHSLTDRVQETIDSWE